MQVSSAALPHGLELIVDFVNTRDIESDTEAWSSPGALGGWLETRGLLAPSARVGRSDLDAAVELREALRAVLLSHHGPSPAPASAIAVLDRVAAEGRLSVRFDPAASALVTLAPGRDGVAGALAAALARVASAAADGTWNRVKACAADDCRWAFYDRSRNRSGRWCDMAVCGNRTKVRSYRASRRT